MTFTFAIPKGRISEELDPLLKQVGIEPEAEYYDAASRKLVFDTSHAEVSIMRARSFDVATFAAWGAASMGVAGSDVLMEFDYPDLYAPLDLSIGVCRMSLAAPEHITVQDLKGLSHVRVATKYPNITKKFFADMGVQAECIKLNGAMELAPQLGLTDYIVDLVSTGDTLKSNGLQELLTIAKISSRLVINRQTYKTRQQDMQRWIALFKEAVASDA